MRFIKTLALALVALIFSSALSAQDQSELQHPYSGPYVGVLAGLEFVKREDESNLGFAYGGIAGYRHAVSDRFVIGAYGLLTESTTSEFDLDITLNSNVAETWSLGGSFGYVFYRDYLVSLDIGYLETRFTDASVINLNPISPGQGGRVSLTTPPDLIGTKSGTRVALVFERPIATGIHTRSQVSRTQIGDIGQRWSFDLGLVLQF